MEKAKTRKIKKWDEVHGEHEVEVSDNTGGCEPEEVAGASPSISRNPMRSIEDMVEQNDNSFDGVINNVKVEPAAGTLEIVPDDKKSVLEKLKEQSILQDNRVNRCSPLCLFLIESQFRDVVLKESFRDGRKIKTN